MHRVACCLLSLCVTVVPFAPRQNLPRTPNAASSTAARRRAAAPLLAKKRKRKSDAAKSAAAPAAPAPAAPAAAAAPEAAAAPAEAAAPAARKGPAPLRIKLPPLPEELDRESQASAASVRNFPVASEAPEVASVEAAAERDGSIFLPDIDELARRKVTRSSNKVANDALPQIERGDTEALRRAMESDPNADVNFNLFRDKSKGAGATKKDVDIITIALGENADKFFGIESAYLQIGHSALVLVILLATFVYDPSFPLTNLPVEFRDFFKQGLAAVYAVNAVLGGVAYFEAQKRDQPVTLWVVKCLFIGGVAFNQLTTSTRIKKPRR
jgi:hypothetical protein